MRELRAGVWHWEAPHPEWKPGEDWDELVSSYALDDGRVEEGSPDLAWLREVDAVEVRFVSAGDVLPMDVHAFPGMAASDVVYWAGAHRAVVAGDTLIDRGNGLELPADWIGDAVDDVREGLRPLLELPVEVVLAAHSGPADRAALERALP